MYSVGDKVVYGSMGVCTVADICTPDLPGPARECYVLKPHYVANSTVYAPVKDNPVNMRPLLTSDQARELVDSLPQITVFPPSKERQELYGTYRNAIRSGDSLTLAKLVKTLYEKKLRLSEQRKIVPSLEKEYFDTAEKMLHGEIAVALQLSIDEVAEYITNRLDAGYETRQAAVS